jgi:hypothetical protein
MAFQSSSPVSTRSAGLNWGEIKSHSSLLTNERIAIILYKIDEIASKCNQSFDIGMTMMYKAELYQLWKNIRSLVRYSWYARNELKLETKDEGVYTIDVAFFIADEYYARVMNIPEGQGFTYESLNQLNRHLNRIEIMIRDILQYFNYLFRPEYKQKPDIEIATEQYKQVADKLTVEQLKQVVGKNHKIDFENLGIVKEEKEEDDETLQIEDKESDMDKDEET